MHVFGDTAHRRRPQSGATTCACPTCGPDPRIPEWRFTDPRRPGVSSSPPSPTTALTRQTRPRIGYGADRHSSTSLTEQSTDAHPRTRIAATSTPRDHSPGCLALSNQVSQGLDKPFHTVISARHRYRGERRGTRWYSARRVGTAANRWDGLARAMHARCTPTGKPCAGERTSWTPGSVSS
jgi:hypothetical protein